MKSKKLTKSLSLNKQTVVHLDWEDLKSLNGGGVFTDFCPPTTVCVRTENTCEP